MDKTVFSTSNLVSFFSALLLLTSLLVAPLAMAQTEEDEFEVDTSTTTEAVIDSVEVTLDPANHPYKLEDLPGERVFNDFVLGPGKIELEIKPGESKVVELNVSNRYAGTKRFSFDVEDMTGSSDPDKGVELLGDRVGPYTLKDYIKIPQQRFDLEADTRAVIPVTISIPPDAEPGGRYGSVLVKMVIAGAEEGGPSATRPFSALVSRIGTLFFITVPGDVDYSGELKDFSVVNHKKVFSEGPVDFAIVYENKGSVHLNPYGEIRITNMFGEEVGYTTMDPWFVMPGSVRLREISWNREFLYGKYTASLSLNRGYNNEIDEKTITFWVIPWKFVGLIFVGVFVFFILVRGFFRKFEFKRKT